MVIVVQFFAADQDAPRQNVGTGVFAGEIAVAPEVTDAVDDASRHDWHPGHLHRPDGEADGAEHGDDDNHHQRHALDRMAAVNMPLHPVVGRAVAVFFHRLSHFGFGAIEFGTFQQHLPDAACLRTVRVFCGFALGVVLAVYRHPLFGDHA